jgi:hypothetical protein
MATVAEGVQDSKAECDCKPGATVDTNAYSPFRCACWLCSSRFVKDGSGVGGNFLATGRNTVLSLHTMPNLYKG